MVTRRRRSERSPQVSLLPFFLSLMLIFAAFAVAPSSRPKSITTRSFTDVNPSASIGLPGYLEVGSDGSIYSFSALNLGGMGGHPLNQPIVGMAATPDGKGYWLVASDGGIFTFGDAGFYGSMGGKPLNKPIVGMASTPDGLGYWEVASDGGIFTFGDAGFHGSMGGQTIPAPVVAMASTDVTALVYPGATGYDISNSQCGGYPPQAPLYVVEISGWPYSQTTPTPCLQSEVSWGGPQTQFYIFMGDTVSIPPGAPTPPPCPAGLSSGDCAGWQNGYSQAAAAYNIAQGSSVHSSIWWLDVETSASSWGPSQSQNYEAILGAIAALKADGELVGVYSTYLQWPEIAGANAALPPGTPIWVADWNTTNPTTACTQAIPFGGGMLAQVQTAPTNFDNDVSC
jgi:hypothetical protein